HKGICSWEDSLLKDLFRNYAKQINQLYEPDQSSRLLTNKEIVDAKELALSGKVTYSGEMAIAKAQLAKDDTRKEASIEEILRLSPIDNSNLIADRWIDLESGFKQAQSRIVKLFKATLCKANPTSEVEG
ncbi:hypothetical protein LCGC14_3083330, partial [marine sediment metagenome]